MTAPRIVVPGATYAVTRRCVCRKAFLGWWHPEVDDIFFWCLVMVAEKCGVYLHHAVRVGSHYHLTFTITRKNLGEFLRLLHHQMSCMLNTLLARERYDAPHELFDARGSHVMRLMDAEAQLGHIVYERLNPPAAGLSDTCDGVPGRTLDPGLWKGAGVRLTRPTVYTASKKRSRVLRVSPPPLLYRAFGGDLDGLVHHIGKLERDGEQAIRAARKRPAKTAAEVRGIHPWDEPMTLRESGGGRVPSFKTGKRGLEGKDAEIRGALEVRGFREAHASANEEWRAGNRDVEYPCGTYEMGRFHGARVADAAWDAWVSAPGPTLDEVKAELARDDVECEGVDPEMLERVRGAVVHGAAEMVDEKAGCAGDAAPREDVVEPSNERPAPETHHRFAKLRPGATSEQPRRIIRLRDNRRRPGNDPPGR
ncbi:MAG: hypothetical protein JJ863_16945 [Deltaproteobacteria bacterium]|nr:hypothetical protein [Deltaproteobacteria bacterium]